MRAGEAARRAHGRLALARTFGHRPTTYQEIDAVVAHAATEGLALALELDEGTTTLTGADLETWWMDLAPGEAVEVLGIHELDADDQRGEAA